MIVHAMSETSVREIVYTHSFGTGPRLVPVVQEETGPVLFLVKLSDGRII